MRKRGGYCTVLYCTVLYCTALYFTVRGGTQKTGFSLKKKDLFTFRTKTLNPLQNTLHWRQYTCPIFFPTVWSISGTVEVWCCWVPPAKLFSPPPRWQISALSMYFSLSGIKRNHRGLDPVNRVGGERQSIPERPNTGPQTKLCEPVRCPDGEINHPISTILVFSWHILSQSPQKLQVKFLIDSLSRRNEFPVHDSSNIEKNNEHRFRIWPHLSCFFWSRWSGRLPLVRSLFGLRVVPIAPTFVARDDRHPLRGRIWQHALGGRYGVKPCASPAGMRTECAAGS